MSRILLILSTLSKHAVRGKAAVLKAGAGLHRRRGRRESCPTFIACLGTVTRCGLTLCTRTTTQIRLFSGLTACSVSTCFCSSLRRAERRSSRLRCGAVCCLLLSVAVLRCCCCCCCCSAALLLF
ncbi:hypothetical protein BZA70DRAFT_273229 [Myxozyma melibiosi]|uniref:Uncharacterized protein n=1 Tax=Myxozyma melibiosi TaxID=54550 RepID=A0ABR1FER3_9ASCO